MELNEFFNQYKKAAIAFSGGTDSAYLLYEAVKNKADTAAYYVRSEFQPEFELKDAERLCMELGVKLNIIRLDILDFGDIAKNPQDRCYYCKKIIMESIMKRAKDDGYETILDGTNASDNSNDRPGMKALEEFGVLSPLKLCRISKEEVRRRSREVGLFTWNKPAYACLATRIPFGVSIDKQTLQNIEMAENEMMKMGFSDFRVRVFNGAAKIQIRDLQMNMLFERREEILDKVGRFFDEVFLDLKAR